MNFLLEYFGKCAIRVTALLECLNLLSSCFYNTVRGVLFTTLYFHEFRENCVIRENLIRELQYLRRNVLLAIGAKKEVRENINVNYQLATDS